MTLTPLAVNVLALLWERPMHPYEMYRLMIDRHTEELLKLRTGSLYHTVARLAADELVAAVGTDRAGGRPERTTYEVTERGREAMLDWVRAELATPAAEYPRFPVALSEAHNVRREEAVALLSERIEAIETETAALRAVFERTAVAVPEAYVLGAHYLFDMRTAEVSWLRRLVQRIEDKELAWPPID